MQMRYILNEEYIKTQNKMDSPLTQALINYNELPPVMLGQVYSELHMSFWGMSKEVCRVINQIHGRGFGHQAMMDDGSNDFHKWQYELAKALLDETGLPIFKEVEQ